MKNINNIRNNDFMNRVSRLGGVLVFALGSFVTLNSAGNILFDYGNYSTNGIPARAFSAAAQETLRMLPRPWRPYAANPDVITAIGGGLIALFGMGIAISAERALTKSNRPQL